MRDVEGRADVDAEVLGGADGDKGLADADGDEGGVAEKLHRVDRGGELRRGWG